MFYTAIRIPVQSVDFLIAVFVLGDVHNICNKYTRVKIVNISLLFLFFRETQNYEN